MASHVTVTTSPSLQTRDVSHIGHSITRGVRQSSSPREGSVVGSKCSCRELLHRSCSNSSCVSWHFAELHRATVAPGRTCPACGFSSCSSFCNGLLTQSQPPVMSTRTTSFSGMKVPSILTTGPSAQLTHQTRRVSPGLTFLHSWFSHAYTPHAARKMLLSTRWQRSQGVSKMFSCRASF